MRTLASQIGGKAVLCVLAAIGLASEPQAGAATVTRTWQGGEGNWTDAVKWGGTVPDGDDWAHVLNGGRVIVNTTVVPTERVLAGGDGNVNELVITNSGVLTVTNSSTQGVWLYPTVLGGTGILTVAGGRLVSVSLQAPRGKTSVFNMNSGEVELLDSWRTCQNGDSVGYTYVRGGTIHVDGPWEFGQINVGGSTSSLFVTGGEIHITGNMLMGSGTALQYHYATQNGGLVHVATNMHLWYQSTAAPAGARAVYTLNGGVLIVGGQITGRNANTPGVSKLVLNGGTLSCGFYTSYMKGMTNSGAALSPGYTNIGYMTVGYDTPYTETTNTCSIHIQLGGTNHPIYGVGAVDYDHLDFGGASVASIQGVLQVSFLGGFADEITSNDVFYVMQASTLNGAFSNVASGGRLDTVGGEGHFRVDYPVNLVSPHPQQWMDQTVRLSDYRFYPPQGTVIIVH